MKFYQLFILSTNSFGEHGTDHEVCLSEDFAMKKGQEIYNCNENVTGYVVVEINGDNRRITYQAVDENVLDLYHFNGGRVVAVY
jgi:hypothetical protein